jgi:uncharacterized protein YndB with AHSA1/START domain
MSRRATPRRLYDMTSCDPTRGRPDPEVRQVRVFRLIQAAPHTLFRLLTDPQCHAQLDGSGMLRGNPLGPDELQLGDIFTMAMSQGGKAYRSTNEVVEFEPDSRIAWRSTRNLARPHPCRRPTMALHSPPRSGRHPCRTRICVGLRPDAAADGLAAWVSSPDAAGHGAQPGEPRCAR